MELIKANLHYLQQAADLVDGIEDGCYARAEPMLHNSTIGGHLRHCLEHYESFTTGIQAGKIDYDARCRDELVESKTCAARERIDAIRQSLENISETRPQTSVLVKMDCGGSCAEDDSESTDDRLWHTSTIGRELQFLVSHTVHHFAMIKGICQRAGADLGNEFGVAPSTLRYREKISKEPASEPAHSTT